MKISIIIPVHNTEKFLSRCVESCLKQSLPQNEFEIILVDDCSSDSCPDLIKKYSNKYNNIVSIFLPENIRQGGARNRGLQIAKGEYVAFVDSDNWIEPDMCEKLYYAAKTTHSDMAGGNIFNSKNEHTHNNIVLNYSSDNLLCAEKKFFYIKNCGYFWSRIYRRNFLIDNKIFFPEGLFYEDAYFNFLTALYANRVEKVEQYFYHYFLQDNSTTAKRNDIRQYERFNIAELILQDCKKRGLYEKFKDIIQYKYVLMHASSILYTYLNKFDIPDKKPIKSTAFALKQNCPKFKKCKYYKSINIIPRFYLNLSLISPALVIWCYKHNIHNYITLLQIAIQKLTPKKLFQSGDKQ